MRTFRKSGGTLCTAPGEIAFLVMDLVLLRHEVPRMQCNVANSHKSENRNVLVSA